MSDQLKNAMAWIEELSKEKAALQAEQIDLRMQLDASCNAEELRQIRAENDSLIQENHELCYHNVNLVAQIDLLREELQQVKTAAFNEMDALRSIIDTLRRDSE